MAFICHHPTPLFLQQKNLGLHNLNIAFSRHSARRKKLALTKNKISHQPPINKVQEQQLSTLNQQVHVKHSKLTNQFNVFQILYFFFQTAK